MSTARRRGYFALRDLRRRAGRRGDAGARRAGGRPSDPHSTPERRDGSPALAVVYASGQCAELVFFENGGICYCRDLEAGLDEATGPIDGESAAGVVRAFVSEIERSLQYYRRAYKEAPQPRWLLLTGDHPAIAPAVEWLGKSQGATVLRVYPLAGAADVETASPGPEGVGARDEGFFADEDAYIAAVGGALRRIDPVAVDLKIARELWEEAAARSEAASRYCRTALAATGILATVGILTTSLLTVHLRQARGARDEVAATAQAARESEEMVTMRDQIIDGDLRRLRRRRKPVSLLLRRLQRAVPAGTALTALELHEDGTLLLRGEARAVPLVRDLVHRLTQDARFRDPELESLDATEEGGTALFVVRTGWLGDGVQVARQP